jgi:hypothetical protein
MVGNKATGRFIYIDNNGLGWLKVVKIAFYANLQQQHGCTTATHKYHL